MAKTIPPADLEQKIDTGMVSLFKDQMRAAVAGTIICILATTLFFWNQTHNIWLFVWTIVMLLLMVFRVLHARYLPSLEQLATRESRWSDWFTIYSLGAGICWGAVPFLFVSGVKSELIFVTMIHCALISGAVLSLSYDLRHYAAYAGMIALPLAAYNFTADYSGAQTISILIVIYLIVNIFFARNVNLSSRTSLYLRYQNVKLIEQLRDQAMALTEEKNNAERANAEKTRFLAAASHDLRQPLHSLGLFLGAMDSHVDNHEGRDLLNKSTKSLQSLDELFSSLLDISKLDAGAIDISPLHFRIMEVLNDSKEQLEKVANKQNIEIHVKPIEGVVNCDPILLQRCLRNLVINAIQHAKCSKITISCEEQPDTLVVHVSDNGSGIPATESENIFNEFHQLNNPERDRRKGLGLGLTIVKRLCELQGHSLTLKSDLGQGSTFSITVPQGNAKQIANIQDQEPQLNDINGYKAILVIDDEEDILDGIEITLNQWQQDVRCGSSIEAAVAQLDDGFEPEIIISDYRLQDNKTGIDAINTLTPRLPDKTQIIFITGDTSPERIIEARQSGYPLLHKPVQPVMLKMTLNRMINNPNLGRLQRT